MEYDGAQKHPKSISRFCLNYLQAKGIKAKDTVEKLQDVSFPMSAAECLGFLNVCEQHNLNPKSNIYRTAWTLFQHHWDPRTYSGADLAGLSFSLLERLLTSTHRLDATLISFTLRKHAEINGFRYDVGSSTAAIMWSRNGFKNSAPIQPQYPILVPRQEQQHVTRRQYLNMTPRQENCPQENGDYAMCCQCNLMKHKWDYTKSQWKNRPRWYRRCKSCIGERGTVSKLSQRDSQLQLVRQGSSFKSD